MNDAEKKIAECLSDGYWLPTVVYAGSMDPIAYDSRHDAATKIWELSMGGYKVWNVTRSVFNDRYCNVVFMDQTAGIEVTTEFLDLIDG